MAITIPTVPYSTTEITLTSSSTDQKPYLGGPIQRIARMGDRWSYKVDCRPMHARQAMTLIATLLMGLSDKVLIEVRQEGVDLRTYTDGTVSGTAQGRTLTHAGGGAVKFVGQFFSVVKDGKRYLHQITAVNGQVLSFLPMLKVKLAGGETLEFGAPKLEGILKDNSQSWTVGMVANTGLTFTVREAN